ncbi:HAD-IA family hydrolase [Streptomyces sp. NPDC056084]|uniref:HAD-IA family hydrolase n=1 Tax=unclassified Streptomyces TaxID=2593676 RepID=UPI0035E2A88C
MARPWCDLHGPRVTPVSQQDALTLPTCVASSGSHDKMRHIPGRTGLYERFVGGIYSSTEVSRGKPAPDLFLHAAQQMGVDPETCVVAEDSQPGVHAARAAGMRAFGYTGGLPPAERLEGHSTVVVYDMRQLPNLIAERQPTLHQALPTHKI